MNKNIDLARQLRQNDVPAEELLWRALRGRRLSGIKFRRQHPIGRFIADFACVECKLAIEIDGESHAHLEAKDAARTAVVEAGGWKVQRIWNTDVYSNLDGVKELLIRVCQERLRDFHDIKQDPVG